VEFQSKFPQDSKEFRNFTAQFVNLSKSYGKPNNIYAMISMTLVLFSIGVLAVSILHADFVLNAYKEHLDVIVELKPNAVREESRVYLRQLDQSTCVKPASAIFISKEEGFSFLRKEMGQVTEFPVIDNPLFDVIVFNVSANCFIDGGLKKLTDQVSKWPLVESVYFPEELMTGLQSNIAQASKILLVLSVIFLIIAIIIIHNTVKLSLFANRFTIKTMQMVGASGSTIRSPFVRSALGIGIWSALWAGILLVLLMVYLTQEFPEFFTFADSFRLMITMGGLVVFGVLISISITWMVINRYLGKSIDSLY